jgi:hypothetical protein
MSFNLLFILLIITNVNVRENSRKQIWGTYLRNRSGKLDERLNSKLFMLHILSKNRTDNNEARWHLILLHLYQISPAPIDVISAFYTIVFIVNKLRD